LKTETDQLLKKLITIKGLLSLISCIYLIKNHPPEVLERFGRHQPPEVAISIITLFELEYGAEKSGQRQRPSNSVKS
jgi:tRNA(fMet)-specific endonuclease VapC